MARSPRYEKHVLDQTSPTWLYHATIIMCQIEHLLHGSLTKLLKACVRLDISYMPYTPRYHENMTKTNPSSYYRAPTPTPTPTPTLTPKPTPTPTNKHSLLDQITHT